MTEEDLANCRNAPGGAARIQPGPPVVVKPQAVVKPEGSQAPQRAAPCEVKPVMSEEDLANCRNAAGRGRSRATWTAGGRPYCAPTAEPARKPAATPCVVKPVMSEEDLIACGRLAARGRQATDVDLFACSRAAMWAISTSEPRRESARIRYAG